MQTSCWVVRSYSVLIFIKCAVIYASTSGVKNLAYNIISKVILKIAQPTIWDPVDRWAQSKRLTSNNFLWLWKQK